MSGDESEASPTYYSPAGFEEAVRRHFDELGQTLQDYGSTHREITPGLDGEYEIDISATFVALDVRFRVLIECKHHRRPVDREPVMVLNQRLQSCGAHKGIAVASQGFQSGAIEFAEHHGIALFRLAPPGLVRIREACGIPLEAIPPYRIEPLTACAKQRYVGPADEEHA